MGWAWRYCLKCEDETSHHLSCEDDKYYCETCNHMLDGRKVRFIEAKLDREHNINMLLEEKAEIERRIKEYEKVK